MDIKRDRFLYEAMGECLHEQDKEYRNPWNEFPKCKICGKQVAGIGCQPGFHTYEGFGKLITWLKTTDLWKKIRWHMPFAEFMELVTDPDKAADRIYEYLKER